MPSRLCLALSLALIARLSAQQYTHLSGLIRDPSDSAVPNADITVVNEDNGFRRSTSSQPDGSYAVASLHPGIYKVTVRKDGFRTLIRFGIKLDVAQPARVDFTLPLGSVQDAITVEGAPALLNTEDASIGTLVSRDWIERLPLNGRGILSLLELTPGTVVTPATRGESGQFTANGQRPNSHYFTVDGVSANTGVTGGGVAQQVTGGALPGMTALGSLHSLAPLEALDEFRVQTATSSTEFGRLSGAQVSLSSRSGTNDLHGSLFHYFRHRVLDANDWFANRQGYPRAPLHMHDYGGSLSGPLRKDRTFFFTSFEGMRLRQPFSWRQAVPTAEGRLLGPAWARPLLNLFPLPDGPSLGPGLAEWTGSINRPARLDTLSTRLDHALTSRVSLFARYAITPSGNEFGNTQVNELSLLSQSVTLGSNLRLHAKAVADLRLNYSHARAESEWRPIDNRLLTPCALGPATSQVQGLTLAPVCDPLMRFAIAGVGQVNIGKESDRRQSQWHFVASTMLQHAAHQVRLGADFRRLHPQRRDRVQPFSILYDSFDDLINSGNRWFATSVPLIGNTTLHEISSYLQDTWRIHPRLTATFGLRWEVTPSPQLVSTEQRPNAPSSFLYPGQTRIWARETRNYAPRGAIAWTPFANGRTVIRGGYGLYFDSSLAVATDLVNGGPLTLAEYRSNRNGFVSANLSFGFLPGLRLPMVRQWSFSAEHSLADRDIFTLSYSGSEGRYLLRRELGGPESSPTSRLILATNHGDSVYHGMQAQYRRRLTRGLQGHFSYAWGHSIDNSSTDASLHWAEDGYTAAMDRGTSDFDVRQTFTGAVSYATPAKGNRWLREWTIDGIVRARTGFPVQIQGSEYTIGLNLANAFRPDYNGRPVWGANRTLNRDAFQVTRGTTQGSLGRNAISGLGMHQVDAALRREFKLRDRWQLQLRVEAFNLFNKPNFADPVRFLSSPLFGQSPSMLNLMLGTGSPGSGLTPVFQTGGPRSLQTVLRIRF